MKVQKIHNIEGFDTELLKRGQIIKLKRVFLGDDIHKQSEFYYLYLIKNVEIDKIEVVNWEGKFQTLELHKFNDTKRDYYSIEKIYDTKDRYDDENNSYFSNPDINWV